MLSQIIRTYSTKQAGISGCLFSYDTVGVPTVKIGWINILKFWKEYCKLLTKDKESKKKELQNSMLYEYITEETTLRFTFQFKFVNKKTKLNEDNVTDILDVIKSTIFNSLQLDTGEAIACVSTSEGPELYILNYTFPSIRIDKNIFNNTIIKDCCDKLRKWSIRSKIPDFIGDWDSVICPLTDYFPVFGCRMSKENPPLTFWGLWSSDDSFMGDDINESFTARRHSSFLSHCSSRDVDEIDEDTFDFTPVIYSSKFSTAVTLPKVEESDCKYSYKTDISSDSEQDMIYHLLPMVSKARLQNPMYRTQIGRCIYNIFASDQAGLELWNSFCPESKDENSMYWDVEFPGDAGINDFLSIRTIGYFAKIDNPDAYDEWHTSWMQEAVSKSFDKIEINIAEVMYRLLWLDFLTVGKNDWYYFVPKGTKLTKSVSNVEFKKRFPELIQFYSRVLTESSQSIAAITMGLDDASARNTAIDKNKVIGEIIRQLGTARYQSAIEKHCFIKFYRENIDQFFDTNPDIMSWGNMVSEVHGDNIYCRDGKMEDFLTRGSNIIYRKEEYSWEHPLVKEVLYWFKTAFVDDDLIDCFLKISASFLYGRNKEKKIYAFCGPKGNNSKTMIDKLFKGVLSVYAIDFPVYVLTDSRQSSGGPTPELAQSLGARIASVAEPDGRIPFQNSLLKRYSGGDAVYARGCNENGRSITPMYKMLLICNSVPPIEGADEAGENRLVIIPYESVYCENAPETEEEQFKQRRFPMDPMFENKIKLYRKPMLWIMMNYFNRYMIEGIVSPPIVQEYTRKYWQENDPYKLFVKENIEKTDSDGDKLKTTDVYKMFKVWYNTNFNTKTKGVPDSTLVVQHLSIESLLGNPSNRIWSRCRFVGAGGDKSVSTTGRDRRQNVD